jgi:hypothetical protein
MKGSHLFWLPKSKGITDIWIRDYNPPRCFQKKISGRGKHNVLASPGKKNFNFFPKCLNNFFLIGFKRCSTIVDITSNKT